MRPALRRGIAAAAVVGLLGSGYAAYAAAADDPAYRTATAGIGDVEETLGLSGTIEPAGRADLAFATSGTVAELEVEAGDRVREGQVLGTLDATALRTQVRRARAELASARAQLESDESAQAAAVSAATSSTPSVEQPSQPAEQPTEQPSEQPSEQPTEQPTEQPDPALEEALAELAAQQEAVTAAQSTVSASRAAAREALTAQQAACEGAFAEGADEAANQACTDALATVQAAQDQVATDQDALQVALDALSGTLAEAIAALQSAAEPTPQPETPTTAPTAQPTTQPTTQPTAQPSTPEASQPTGSATAPEVTAATLARDQAAIDQAQADLLAAREELRMATVRAPFGGEVVSVDAAEGDSVASGTAVFVLVSRGTTTVEVTATSTQVRQLEVGQPARVTPTGSDRTLAGTVTQVSSVPDESSSYPVTITLDRRRLDLATGLSASVAVVTGTASDVVTVPASAVSDGAVQVVEDGAATRVPVTTGVTGATTIEIAEGIAEGDVVVLADLDRALPSGDTETGGFGPGGGELRLPAGGGTFPGPVTFQQAP